MYIKDKVKDFGRVILLLLIGIGITIVFVISLPLIPIISIFDFISEILIALSPKKKFTASNALKKELEQLQDNSLADYNLLLSSNISVLDLTDDQEKAISMYREVGYGDYGKQLIEHIHDTDKDEIRKKLLYGYYKLNNDALAKAFEDAGFKEEESIFPNNIVRRITIVPKIFLFLLLRAAEAIGLSHVKLPKSETYKKEITAAFSLFKSKAIMLLNRSAVEKEVASSLYAIIYDYITLFENSVNHLDFARSSQLMIVEPSDRPLYSEINNKIVEKLVDIFGLLTSVKLRLDPQPTKEEFKKNFIDLFYNLMICVGSGDLYNIVDYEDMLSTTVVPELEDGGCKHFQYLEEKFSDFLDNLLKNKALSSLAPEEKKRYIDICCMRVLKDYINHGSPFGGYCPAPKLPSGYEDHAKNIATYLSNDIVKALNLSELNNIYGNRAFLHSKSKNKNGYDINKLLEGLLTKESITIGLCDPINAILSMVAHHIGKKRPKYSGIDRVPPAEAFRRSSSVSLFNARGAPDMNV